MAYVCAPSRKGSVRDKPANSWPFPDFPPPCPPSSDQQARAPKPRPMSAIGGAHARTRCRKHKPLASAQGVCGWFRPRGQLPHQQKIDHEIPMPRYHLPAQAEGACQLRSVEKTARFMSQHRLAHLSGTKQSDSRMMINQASQFSLLKARLKYCKIPSSKKYKD